MPIKLPTAIQNVTNKGKFVRTRWESTDKLAKDAIVTYAIVSADSLLGFVLLMMRVGILYFSPAQTSRSATLGLTPTVLFGLQTLSTSPPQIQQDMISTFSGEYPARWVPRESGEIIGNLITDDELCFGAPRKLLTLGEVFFASEQIALGEIPTSDWPIYCNFAWKVANYDSRGAIRRTGRRNAKKGWRHMRH